MVFTALKRMKNEAGQAVVELAITLPILIIILCGIIDYGWIITNQNAVDHSAREGARYAIVHSSGSGAVADIKEYTLSLVPQRMRGSMNVAVTFTNPNDRRSGDVIIDVSAEVSILTPVVGIFFEGQAVSLNSSCRMKVE
ncbi:MAG: TadE/TadG family type IV pilus assembly protein [Christensenellales bacterium]|jgi:Flp pilus assembly protein TadG